MGLVLPHRLAKGFGVIKRVAQIVSNLKGLADPRAEFRPRLRVLPGGLRPQLECTGQSLGWTAQMVPAALLAAWGVVPWAGQLGGRLVAVESAKRRMLCCLALALACLGLTL